jgi:hypothetical protein
VQPNPPSIGKFKAIESMDPDEFEKQQVFAREFAVEEENFYQDQLRDGIKEGYFRNSAARPGEEEQQQEELGLLPGSNQNQAMVVDVEMHEESDVELVHGAPARRGTQRRRLARMDEQPEDIADSADEEEDEDFDEEDKSQSSENMDEENDDENDDDFDGLASEYAGNRRIHRSSQQNQHSR